MRITLVPLYLAATLFQKIRGRAAVAGNLRDLFSLLWGSVLPLPFLLCSPSDISAIRSGTYISQHLGTYRQMGKPGLPTACFSGATLMDAYRDHHACVKIEIIGFFFAESFASNLGTPRLEEAAAFLVYCSVLKSHFLVVSPVLVFFTIHPIES